MADLIKVSILGALPTGEVWSVNPVFQLGPPPDVILGPEADAIAQAIVNLTVPTGIMNCLSSGTTVTGCRVEARSFNGDLEAIGERAKAVPQTGTGATPHPYQTSIVTSLRTLNSGPRARGRLYWPATGMSLLTSSLRGTPATITSFLAGVRSYMTAIETAIDTTADVTGVHLAVWSRSSSSVSVVNKIQVGDVLDVQRRRRDALIEVIQELPYPS